MNCINFHAIVALKMLGKGCRVRLDSPDMPVTWITLSRLAWLSYDPRCYLMFPGAVAHENVSPLKVRPQ